MFIKKLCIENYRNYAFGEADFSENQNLIFGENAQGKTNLIEAIFYLSCLKTFRGKSDFDAVKTGEKEARIRGIFSAYGREFEIKCDITSSGRRLFVNGVKITKPSEHIGLIKTVVFSPNDLLLIKEGPALRRRFLNIAISQIRPSYIKALSEHNKIIENKRKILRLEDKTPYIDFYDVLNEKLSKCAAIIIRERGRFIEELSEKAKEIGFKISGGREELSFSYKAPSSVTDFNANDLENVLYEHLKKRRDAEFASEMCLVGAHRDDFEVFINGESARDFGSQGQIRSAVLAIKVSEHDILKKNSGEEPILLLDDVLSELDPGRRSFLLNDIDRGQTIITGCDPAMFEELKKGKIFTIEKGSIAGEQRNDTVVRSLR